MCGIAGICRLDGQPLNEDARAHVRAMTDVITYRGPDGSGIWQEGPVSLGHRRLSIIDLSGGSQPMQDVDGELCIVFNGEIYNFAELRQELLQAGARFHSSHSDTEVILQAYRVWGTDCLQRFDGMFAFALWDAPRRRLFCARDRFGKKPFFYTLQQGSLFFGSELNCLAAVPGLELTLDPQAVMRYLAYEYVPTPDTMYREAKSLPPSHWLLVEDGRLSIRRYWDLPPADEDDRRSEADICADVHELLTRAVGRPHGQRRAPGGLPLRRHRLVHRGRSHGPPVFHAHQDIFHRLHRGQLRREPLRPRGGPALEHRPSRARALGRGLRRASAQHHQPHGRAHGRRLGGAHPGCFRA